MKLTATKSLKRYAGKVLKAGDVFECKAADVRILLAIKHAVPYVAPTPTYVSRDVIAESDGSDKPKRAYKRRDMTAE